MTFFQKKKTLSHVCPIWAPYQKMNKCKYSLFVNPEVNKFLWFFLMPNFTPYRNIYIRAIWLARGTFVMIVLNNITHNIELPTLSTVKIVNSLLLFYIITFIVSSIMMCRQDRVGLRVSSLDQYHIMNKTSSIVISDIGLCDWHMRTWTLLVRITGRLLIWDTIALIMTPL